MRSRKICRPLLFSRRPQEPLRSVWNNSLLHFWMLNIIGKMFYFWWEKKRRKKSSLGTKGNVIKNNKYVYYFYHAATALINLLWKSSNLLPCHHDSGVAGYYDVCVSVCVCIVCPPKLPPRLWHITLTHHQRARFASLAASVFLFFWFFFCDNILLILHLVKKNTTNFKLFLMRTRVKKKSS